MRWFKILKENLYLLIGAILDFSFQVIIFFRLLTLRDIKMLWSTFWPYLILIIGFAQTRLFSLIPEDEFHIIFNSIAINPMKQWIPYYPHEFHLRTHIYFMSQHVNYMIVYFFCWFMISRIERLHWFIRSLPFVFIWAFWLEFVDLIDYMIIYNEHYTVLFGWEAQYNDIKLITLGFIIFIAWVKSLQSFWSQS